MKSFIQIMSITISVFCLATAVEAQQKCRPCGPDSIKGPLRILIPQGAAGASFKSACAQHDACYGTTGSDKVACDEQFRVDLNCACEGSRNPVRCRRRARLFYNAVARWGDGAFEAAQQKH